MSDLDVIREARDYLAGLIEKSEVLDPASWAVKAGPEGSVIVGFTKDPITWDDHGGEVFEDPTARLIVALRAAAPQIIRLFDRQMLNTPNGWVDPEVYLLARAILATKGHNDD